MLRSAFDRFFSFGPSSSYSDFLSTSLVDDVEVANFDYLSFNDKKFLGCGGEGDVYKAYSKKLEKKVALKRCGRSFQENNLIELSNSDNIVRMHGLLLDSSRSVGYVMEYMKLGSLHDAIHSKGKFKENRLNYGTNTILLWVHHAACGIKTLHDADIIHRDIKPQNILLGKNIHDVKISDFGLARDITASTLKTLPCGTEKYQAPEIEDGRFKKAGDIFAFAITCWEMIERRVPHEHAKDLINSRPKFESGGSIYAKLVLQGLIEKGWSRDPDPRPSIEKFVEAARQHTSLQTNCDILLSLVRLTVWAEELCRISTGYKLSVPREVLTQNGFYGQTLNGCTCEFVVAVHNAMRNCLPEFHGIVYCVKSISMKRIMDFVAAFGSKHGTAAAFFDVELTAGNIHKAAETCKQIFLDSCKKGIMLKQWVATDLKMTTDECTNQVSNCNDNYAKLAHHKSEINEYKSIVKHPSQSCTLETFEECFELCEKLKQVLNREFLVNNVSDKLQAAEKGAALASSLAKTANKEVGELKIREDSLRKYLSSIENMNSELKNIQQIWEETALKFENVKESIKNLLPLTGKLSTKNGCTEAELAEFLRKPDVLMIEQNRVISDAVLYEKVYIQLMNQKLARACDCFFSTNGEQMERMPDIEQRLLMAEQELRTLVKEFENRKGWEGYPNNPPTRFSF